MKMKKKISKSYFEVLEGVLALLINKAPTKYKQLKLGLKNILKTKF